MTQSDVLIRYSEAKEALGGGCSDGYCCVEKPTGMHTNGGCKCASNPDFLRQQRMANIMRLAQEMSSEITRLRAALADAQAVGFAAGVEAAAKEIEGDDYNIGRAMSMAICCSGHECGCMGASVRDYLVYNIRAITPPDATAAAARVLLGDEAMIEQIAEKFARKDKFGLVEPFALEESVSDLRDCLSAIAGDTP
jgi:hypothetical protein